VSIAAEPEPWISPGGATILSACVLIICGLIVAIVELRKTRVSQNTVEHEMKPNHGGSLRDAVNKLTDHLERVDGKVDTMAERLVRVETLNEFMHVKRRDE
jgi:hypothetical protein